MILTAQDDLARLPDYNFDHPDAFDTPLMLKVIQARALCVRACTCACVCVYACAHGCMHAPARERAACRCLAEALRAPHT